MANNYKVFIPLKVFKKTNYWIAYCPVLKTFGYSKEGKDEAIKDFDNALKTFLHVQQSLGKLHETMRSLGWTFVGKGESPQPTMPDIPDYLPERRYRVNAVNTVEHEILMPA